MKTAAFAPGIPQSTVYAMSADDISMHFDLDNLTPKQHAEHENHKDLMGFLQASLIGIGKPSDHLMLYEEFADAPWPDRLNRLRRFFESMNLETIPAAHWHYHPKHTFYESVATDIPEVETVTLYSIAGSNAMLHNDPEALKVSQDLNSKVHFADNAPAFGIPVPDTLATTKADLGKSFRTVASRASGTPDHERVHVEGMALRGRPKASARLSEARRGRQALQSNLSDSPSASKPQGGLGGGA